MINIINRNNATGLVANIVLFVSLAVLGNIAIYVFGWSQEGEDIIRPRFAPPGYVVGIVWLFLFALMGTARWFVVQSTHGRTINHSRWIIFLAIFCVFYPLYTFGLSSWIAGLIGNIATILLTTWVIYQVQTSSKRAAKSLLPIIVWVSFASVIIIRTIRLN